MAKLPSLDQFNRIVVKVGSSLLVDSNLGAVRRAWLDALAGDIAALHEARFRAFKQLQSVAREIR